MFDIALRRLKDDATRPIARLIPRSIYPGHVTFLALILGLLACWSATSPQYMSAAVYFWLTNRLFDCVDGALARERGLTSELGGFCDLLSDFVVYSLIPISVAYGQFNAVGDSFFTSTSFLAITLLESTFHINNFILFYCAAVAAAKDDKELTSVTMKPALVEGFESGLLFTAMFIWPQYVIALSWIMSAGVVIGTVQRIALLVPVLKHLDIKKSKS